jgi:uncharacterized protein (TIGR00730 family)
MKYRSVLIMLRRICVYCGSSSGLRPVYAEAARTLGRLLAAQGIELVYGGACRGLMGYLADAVLQGGGRAIGVIPQAMVDLEVAHQGLTELRIVKSMHERKALMTDLADAFLILPGAWGTLDELCEAVTWLQLGIHNKPCGLWNVNGYYDPFLAFLRHAVAEGFLKKEHCELLTVRRDIDELLKVMRYSNHTGEVPCATVL